MGTRLVNVRLDDSHLRKARRLREQGIVLSDLIREAIDRRYEQLSEPPTPADIPGRLEQLFALHPDPPGLPPRLYDVHNREQAREAVVRKLGRTDVRTRR